MKSNFLNLTTNVAEQYSSAEQENQSLLQLSLNDLNSIIDVYEVDNFKIEHRLLSIASKMSTGELADKIPPAEFRKLGLILSKYITLFNDQAQTNPTNSSKTNPSKTNIVQLRVKTLTEKERDVLLLLANGLRNEAIAKQIGVAEITVRKHIISARKKLNAKTREHALMIAIRDGHIVP